MALVVDAARREVVEILRLPVDDDAQRVLGDAFIADGAKIIELFLTKGGDAERHVLQPRGAACRGHDDVMLVARTVLGGGIGRRRGLARLSHGGGGQREQGGTRSGREKLSLHINYHSRPPS